MKLGSQDSGRYSNLDKSPLATNLKTNPSYLSPNYDFSNLKNNTMPNTVPNTGPNAEFQRTGNGGSNAHGYANLSKKLNFHQETRYNVNDVKTITKDSQRRILGAISMSDLFKQNIDNRDMKESSYSKILNSASRKQQLEILHNEHRLQVQKLLLQISRLHDVIYELERSKKYEVQRIKQECEQVTYLHISNIKQSQISQMQILQIQLKKTKQILENKSTEFEELYRTTTKEKQLLKSEIQLLRNSVKDLVNKKNQEVFEIKKENDEKVKQLNRSNNNAIQEMKQLCDREIKKLYKQLQDKEDKVMKLQEQYEQTYSRNGQLEDQIEKQKAVLEQKLSQYVKETNKRYQGLIQHVSTVLNDQEVSLNEREATVKQIYDVEIANLLKIIKLKNEQNIRINAQLQTQRLEYRLLSQNIENQNEQILRLLRNQKLKNLQQLELLKVKMAILHQNDIKQLVNLYETKIECLNQELSKQSTETTRLRQFMHGQLARSYESKKKYEDTISKLNVQILRLKSGLGSLEKQMKQRIQSQRSAMLLTSKSLIRGVQLKNTNTKFYEQQLRKLRLTIQKQEHDFEKNEKILKQQIHNLQQQMNKLIDLSKQNEKQNQKIEEEYIKTIEDKQNQIKRLNQLARDLIQENGHGESEEIKEMGKQIERLNQQVQEKNQKLKQLQNKLDKLDRDLQQCKIQNEQLYLQNQINHEQAKGEYQKIASTNMRSLKQFYQRKLQQLQTDKQQLKNQRNLDKNTINQLVRKYQVMEDCMAKAVRQSKRKTKLEERIMDLGMDQNLVKNMGEIFRRDD